MVNKPTVDAEELLGHAAWVRELARRLVRDAHLADDAAQETLSTALANPPRSRSNLRGWLAVLLRNTVRAAHRSRARREARERLVAHSENPPGTQEIVERLDLHRQLVDEVQRLSEPYRTAILLRYLENRSLVEISGLTGDPVSTISSRVQRGLDQLRVRFDARHDGNRDAWVLAMMPLLVDPAQCALPQAALPQAALPQAALPQAVLPPATAGSPSFAAITATITALGAIVILVLVGINLRLRETPASPANAAAARAAIADNRGERRTAQPAAARGTASVSNDSPAAPGGSRPTRAAVPADANAGAAGHRGRLLDQAGAPLAGLEVGLVTARSQDSFPSVRGDSRRVSPFVARGESDAQRRRRTLARTHSDALGAFEIDSNVTSGRIVVLEPGWTTVLAGVAYEGLRDERIVIAARSRTITGDIVDVHGDVIAGAAVGVRLPAGFRGGFDEVLDHSVEAAWGVSADATGAFRIDDSPSIDGCELLAQAPGFVAAATAIPSGGSSHHRIVLLPEQPVGGTVRGFVSYQDGLPVSDAVVSLGDRLTRTDRGGRFEIGAAPQESNHRRLHVVRPGYQAAILEQGDDGSWPDPVLVTLSGEPGVLHGRVVDANGSAAPGAWVWLADPTVLPVAGHDPIVVESLLAGNPRSTPNWNVAIADGRGRFRIAGLLDRDYRVRASIAGSAAIGEARSDRHHRSDRRPASVDGSLEIRLPGTNAMTPRIAGTVVDRDGTPLAGVVVTASSIAVDLRVDPGDDAGWRWAANGPSTRTDADGRFALRDVPHSAESLHLAGSGVFTTDLPLADLLAGSPAEDLHITLPMRCHLRVEASGIDDPGIDIEVRDEHDRVVPVRLHIGIGMKPVRTVELESGASPVLAIPDTAREIRISRDGVELDRQWIEPRVGQVIHVRSQLDARPRPR